MFWGKEDFGILLMKSDLGRGVEVTGYIKHPRSDDFILCSCTFVTWQDDYDKASEYVLHYLKIMAEAVMKTKPSIPKQTLDEVLAEIEVIRKERESKPYQDQ